MEYFEDQGVIRTHCSAPGFLAAERGAWSGAGQGSLCVAQREPVRESKRLPCDVGQEVVSHLT